MTGAEAVVEKGADGGGTARVVRGELIPIRGVWFKVVAVGEHGITLVPHSHTSTALKRARAAKKAERRRKWVAAGRKIT